jgi:PEP-CTERM motif
MKRVLARAALFGAATFLCGLPAEAVLIAPGATVALPGTTSALEPQLAGVVQVDELIPFSFFDGVSGGTIFGQVQQRVVRSSVDGTLDFYWRVFNDIDSSAAIGSFRLGDFVSPEYNANWRIDGLGERAPDSAHRFTGSFDTFVNFNFTSAPGLLPGEESYFLLLDTTATHYAKTAIFDLANVGHTHISGLFDAYSPAEPIPEPTSVTLLGLGLIGLAKARKRRGRVV